MDIILSAGVGYIGSRALGATNRQALAATALFGGLASVISRGVIGLKREDYILEEWAKLYKEEALDPEEEIIDPHHHLWDFRSQDKGWPISKSAINILYKLKPQLMEKLLGRSLPPELFNTFGKRIPIFMIYMADEILRDIGNDGGKGHNVTHTVYLECGWHDPNAQSKAFAAVPEVKMAQNVANRTKGRICSGIIAFVDLRLGAEECEPAIIAMKKNPNFRGLRHALAYSENKSIVGSDCCTKTTAYDPKFRSAFKLISKYDLVYDSWLFHENIPAFMDLALAFPDTTMVLDHVGLPLGLVYGRDEVLEQWSSSISELARRCPNVHVKLSGLAMRVCGFRFDERDKPPTSKELAESWKYYILHCIKCFGVKRCMFASNFPVDKISCSYTVLWNAFKRIVSDAGFSSEERRALFYGNAKRVYKLN